MKTIFNSHILFLWKVLPKSATPGSPGPSGSVGCSATQHGTTQFARTGRLEDLEIWVCWIFWREKTHQHPQVLMVHCHFPKVAMSMHFGDEKRLQEDNHFTIESTCVSPHFRTSSFVAHRFSTAHRIRRENKHG